MPYRIEIHTVQQVSPLWYLRSGLCELAMTPDGWVMLGPNGKHELSSDPAHTDGERLRSHWDGFRNHRNNRREA